LEKIYEVIKNCRLCESTNLKKILDLTDQPPANSLYKAGDAKPPKVPLKLLFCNDCSAVQLDSSVDPKYLFSRYVWVTGTSKTAEDHSIFFSKTALKYFNGSTNLRVMEVASNDGTFLQPFKSNGCEILGVDPAKNIAEEATRKGIPTIGEFFSESLANDIVRDKGEQDIVFARNVLPHVKEIHSVVKGINISLKNNGLGIIEFHDAGLILDELHYDSIYHEHLFLLSLKTISELLKRYSLFVFDIHKSPISGGSWIIFFSKQKKEKSTNLISAEENDKLRKVDTLQRWENFASESKKHCLQLRKTIKQYEGKILAYGASARSSTLINFCGLSDADISAIIDKNPLKHGLLTPGSNIPIISFEEGMKFIEKTEIILLLAWNFENEIIQDLRRNGYTGKFIVPLPNRVTIK